MVKHFFKLFFFIFFPFLLFSQEEELRELKEKIRTLKNELEKAQNTKKTYENELKKVDLQIEITKKELRKIEIEKNILKEKVSKTAAEVLSLKNSLEKIKERLNFKLKILQKMGRLGYLRLFFTTKGDNFLNVLRWILYFSNEDRKIFINYNQLYEKLKIERRLLKEGEEKLKIMEEDIKWKIKEMEEIEKQKKFLIAQLDRKTKETEVQLTLYKEKAEKLENLLKILSSKEEVLTKEDVHKYKGALNWPFKGKIKTGFGRIKNPQYSTSILSNGIEVEIGKEADIYPVFPGKVIFSRWFKGYNNLIVIDHGNGLLSITGYLQISYVKEGEWIHSRKAIGRITSEPYIYYLELRDKNVPVDPLEWLR